MMCAMWARWQLVFTLMLLREQGVHAATASVPYPQQVVAGACQSGSLAAGTQGVGGVWLQETAIDWSKVKKDTQAKAHEAKVAAKETGAKVATKAKEAGAAAAAGADKVKQEVRGGKGTEADAWARGEDQASSLACCDACAHV